MDPGIIEPSNLFVWFLKSEARQKYVHKKVDSRITIPRRKRHLPFLAASRKNMCKEPDELVAARTSGRSMHGPNESE